MASWIELLSDSVDALTLEKASEAQRTGQDAVGLLLACVAPGVLLAAQSRHYNRPFLHLDRYHPALEAIRLVPEELVRKFCVLPLFVDDEQLYLAMVNPDELTTMDYLQQLTRLSIEPVLATRVDLEAAINRAYLTQEQSARAMDSLVRRGRAAAAPQAVVEAPATVHLEEAPAIKLVNYMLGQAINMGASDVHLEDFPERVLLRYRVDGVLHEFPGPPKNLYKALVSRVKIISSMDVAERRLPQDGRANIVVNQQSYDLRVSIIPNLHGEGIVIRILDTHGSKKTLQDVGFEPSVLERYQRLIKKPHGILLVTGPTGAGKSTTLYATLQQIYTPKKKIITLEDPVEYVLEGITQIPVHPGIGFTFASALRSVLRHDPDVVMLGEIRDAESAEIAIRGSMTGHLVFSTLHTNDAPSAVARLLDMGIPAYLVMSSLSGVLAQRLLRRLCPQCKVAVELSPEEMGGLDLPRTVYRPEGCTACNRLGYRGRVAIYELLEITPEVRRVCNRDTSAQRVREVAGSGFVSLRESAVLKLREGIVSLEDVLELTMEE